MYSRTRVIRNSARSAATALRAAALALLALIEMSSAAAEKPRPIEVLANARLDVTTTAGTGKLALYVSRDWNQPQPQVHRAIIVFHGVLRNADTYFHSGQESVAAAGPAGADTLVVAPQFLNQVDTAALAIESSVLRWQDESWEGGADALAPAAISSYSAIDSIIERLADRTTFPNLGEVVLVGHSGGGQVVARYAVVGRAEATLGASGIKVRYVIANPSSYLYFSEERPVATTEASCPGYNNWKYGWSDAPPYVTHGEAGAFENAFMARDVVYLLGSADTDPHHPALDRSCAGEAQGPYRFARGQSYVRYLAARRPGHFSQRLYVVPGVGHDGRGMLTSTCGLAAVFDTPGCTAQAVAP